jgi:hypothetical protein
MLGIGQARTFTKALDKASGALKPAVREMRHVRYEEYGFSSSAASGPLNAIRLFAGRQHFKVVASHLERAVALSRDVHEYEQASSLHAQVNSLAGRLDSGSSARMAKDVMTGVEKLRGSSKRFVQTIDLMPDRGMTLRVNGMPLD